jgi:hypothetical protein
MAEKNKSENSKSSLSLGMIILLIFLALFAIWVFTNKPKSKTTTVEEKTENKVKKYSWPPSNEIPSYGKKEENSGWKDIPSYYR